LEIPLLELEKEIVYFPEFKLIFIEITYLI